MNGMEAMKQCVKCGVVAVSLLLGVAHATATPTHQRIYSAEELKALVDPTRSPDSLLMQFEERTLQLDTLSEEGDAVEGSFRFTYQGEQPLTIQRVTADCHCTEVEFPKEAIASGERGEIHFRYHPKGFPGKLQRVIFVYTDQSANAPMAKLILQGFVAPSGDRLKEFPHLMGGLLLKQSEVTISLDGRRQVERIAAYNNSDHPLTVGVMAGMGHPALTLNSYPATIPPHSEAMLLIAFDPERWEGEAQTFPLVLSGLRGRPSERTLKIRLK